MKSWDNADSLWGKQRACLKNPERSSRALTFRFLRVLRFACLQRL